MHHAWRPPRPGEPLHVEHLLRAITQVIDRTANDRQPARWHFRFRHDGDYLIESDGQRWSLTSAAPRDQPDVTITATTHAWIQFVPDPSPGRASELDIDIHGDPNEIRRFQRLLRTFPHEQQRLTEGITE